MEYPPSCWLIREAGLFETAVARPAGNLSVEVLAKVPNQNLILKTLLYIIYPHFCIQARDTGRIMDDFRVVLSGNQAIHISQVNSSSKL
jgi:hypothetical protein